MNTTPHPIQTLTRRTNHSRFDPLRNLTPDILSRQLDAFESGYLREAVETWDAIEKRDDLLKSVIPKRKKSISRHGWEVYVPRHTERSQLAEAAEHKQALEHFYRNLTCTNAIDANERGAFKLLIRQMMDAVGKRYAVHEIVWKPSESEGLTAEFRFVPLSYFENTTGALRFLDSDGAIEGRPLEPGAWLVTAGEGLMVASSVAWMFKNLSLKDWLEFSQRHGTPALHGTTIAARDSADWNEFRDTVNDLLAGQSAITNSTDAIKVLDLAQGGQIPFPILTERMDRMMAALWRGADLSTLSREHGYGASLQDRESCLLEEDDCELISETLNERVDAWVIRYLFGKDVKPLARVRVLPAPRECSEYDLRVDQFLLTNGAPLSLNETLERYGRELPEAGDAVLQLNKPLPNCGSGTVFHVPGGDGSHFFPSAAGNTLKNQSVLTSAATEEKALESQEHQSLVTTCNVASGAASTMDGTVFTLLQGDWIQISPPGDFPHGQGIQRVDGDAIGAITRHFNSLPARLGRLFVGVPFYIGHPDVPSLAREYPDRKAYGWIQEVEAREDGLVAKVKWSDEGRTLLEQGHYKFLSPYWEADEIATEQGRKIFRPKRLISVGLTNQPNIPVLPLANESAPICSNEGNEARLSSLTAVPETESQSVVTSTTTEKRANSALDPSSLHTSSLTNELGRRNSQRGRALSRQARIQELVTENMAFGNSYDDAWNSVKLNHPALFE
jgi:hypothetical protein